MSNYNKVILVGNVTRDPELKFSTKGMPIGRLGIAVNRKWKSESGEQKEEVTFVDVDCFGKQAETVGQYLKKGRSVLIEGRLKLDQWDDKATGQKRSKLGVVMESFQFIGGKDQAAAPSSSHTAPPAGSPAASPGGGDDVPF